MPDAEAGGCNGESPLSMRAIALHRGLTNQISGYIFYTQQGRGYRYGVYANDNRKNLAILNDLQLVTMDYSFVPRQPASNGLQIPAGSVINPTEAGSGPMTRHDDPRAQSLASCRDCGEIIQRSDLREHMEHHCPTRRYSCTHCGCLSTYKNITTTHYDQCAKYPLCCPHGCQTATILRYQMEEHLRDCPLQPVECSFRHAGCTAEVPRRELSKHSEENMEKHLALVCELTRDLALRVRRQEDTIRTLREEADQLRLAVPVVPFEFSLSDYRRLKSQYLLWTSQPFYTHHGGYKMCVGVYAGGHDPPHSRCNCVSVFCTLLRGEYDCKLEWPLRVRVTLQLLNWRGIRKVHCEQSGIFTFERCTRGGVRAGKGWPRFIPHSEVQHLDHNVDVLHFRVASVQILEHQRPDSPVFELLDLANYLPPS